MTAEDRKQILIEYQLKELNSKFEKNLDSAVDILSRLMVFSMPNSPRKKLVYLSSHQSYKVDIEQLLEAIEKENLLARPNWSSALEYYTINPITREEKNSFIKKAMFQGVFMTIFDYSFVESNEKLCSLIGDKSDFEYGELDPIKKGVYEILAYGAESTNIKQRIIESYILHTLYNSGLDSISKDSIVDLVAQKGIALSTDISSAISSLLPKRFISKDPNNKKNIILTEKGKQAVGEARIRSIEEEANFKNTLRSICEKYKIEAPIDDVITHLKELALSAHSCVLHQTDPSQNAPKQFLAYLQTIGVSNVTECVNDLQLLCLYNPFISRISVGEIFVNQVGSSEIETYTKNSIKNIYLDTPVIGYILCNWAYKKEKENDWSNFKYQATRDLMELIDKYSQEIQLHIRYSYLQEVAGEMQKALRLQLLDNANFKLKFKTSNTFYQYYQYIREEKGFHSVSDFFKDIIMFDTHVDHVKFVTKTAAILQNIFEERYGKGVTDTRIVYDKNFEEIKMNLPTKYLIERNEYPLENDINQVLRIRNLSQEKLTNCHYFIASWDDIFKEIRNKIQAKYDPDFIVYVSSPTQLASQFAMAHFNMSSSILTDAMFITADTKDAIRRLYDNALSLLVDSSGDPSLSSIRKLIDAQIEYMQTNPISEENLERDGYPLENVIDGICSKVHDWGLSMTYLRKYINDAEQFDIIKSDLDEGYEEIYKKKDYLNGKAIENFKEHFIAWASEHPEVDTLEEDEGDISSNIDVKSIMTEE